MSLERMLATVDRVRRSVMYRGVHAATEVVDSCFPPHPGDPYGHLTLAATSQAAAHQVDAAYRQLAGRSEQRQWWTMGFIAGLASATAQRMLLTDEQRSMPAQVQLRALLEAVGVVGDREQHEVATSVAAIVVAIIDADPLAGEWALESLKLNAPEEHTHLATLRTGHCITAALHLLSGAWAVHLSGVSDY